ncbi:MAG: 16S rRNA (guanine(966)-N(2))-methyltransferase RsmD [Oscillospiraceae bacterium]|nr:16S rRNA (guanine(966)-N(2))-methyltransferase RsmD [Oscillospiraceae bacterium]
MRGKKFLRVISGSEKGKKIKIPKEKNIRPTKEKVKEAIFSALQFEIEGKCFLDLFAGSGQIGIEAMSRGASEAIFVDNNPKSVGLIRKNLRSVDLFRKSSIFLSDATKFLKNTNLSFDLVFLDPPYAAKILTDCLNLLTKKMRDGGIVVCESAREAPSPEITKNFIPRKCYYYGETKIIIYDYIIK